MFGFLNEITVRNKFCLKSLYNALVKSLSDATYPQKIKKDGINDQKCIYAYII